MNVYILETIHFVYGEQFLTVSCDILEMLTR